MLDKTLASRYGNALYQSAKAAEGTVAILADLEQIQLTIKHYAALKRIFYHPGISPAEKKQLAQDIFKESITPTSLRFLGALFHAKRILYLDLIHTVFLDAFNQDKNKAVVKISTYQPLPQQLLDKIKAQLAKMLGKEVEMQVETDSRLLGGITIDINGDVIDGSVSYQLNKLSEKMLAG
jgi:F-type H+-transporting ATPase subunit delta